MTDKPKSEAIIRDFAGLNLQTDDHDLPAGQMDRQKNITSGNAGKLESRQVLKPVTFEND